LAALRNNRRRSLDSQEISSDADTAWRPPAHGRRFAATIRRSARRHCHLRRRDNTRRMATWADSCSYRTRVPHLVAALVVSGVVALAVTGATASGRAPARVPDCPHHRSRSIGSPGQGRLMHGALFPATGPDHFAWNFREQRPGGSDRTRWGHCSVVRAVLRGLAVYRERNPDAPLVAVGDMGLRHGGEIDGHSTHENGRQIDLYFPRRDRKRREPRTIAQVDAKLAGELVQAMLDAGADRVLIGPRVRIEAPARVLRWPNHDDHLHAMF
jgi:Penicillin-insensitive murein endopeptidase